MIRQSSLSLFSPTGHASSPLISLEKIGTPSAANTPLNAAGLSVLALGTLQQESMAPFCESTEGVSMRNLFGSPLTLSHVPTYFLSIDPVGAMPTGPLRAVLQEPATRRLHDTALQLLIKPWQRERAKRQLCHVDGLRVEAYPFRETPFTEVVVGCFIQECLEKANISCCRVPSIGYVQVGHPAVAVMTAICASQVVVRGTGSAQELLQNLRPIFSNQIFVEKSLEQAVSPLAVEILAVLDLILLNGDRNIQNLLVDEQGKLVLIDHSYTLPIGDANWVLKVCWMTSETLTKESSVEVQQFVRMLDLAHLPTLAQQLARTLRENLDKLPQQHRDNEEQSLGVERILPHQIAICFVQYCMLEKKMSLFEIAQKLLKSSGNIVQTVYQRVDKTVLPQDLKALVRPYFEECLSSC